MLLITYAPNMRRAAHRHWEAAEALRDGPSRSVAGYLYGIACECAIKQHMLDAGLREGAERGSNPFYAHFPYIKTMLDDAIKGRGMANFRKYVTSRFMQDWSIEMRYSDGTTIQADVVERWRADADVARSEL